MNNLIVKYIQFIYCPTIEGFAKQFLYNKITATSEKKCFVDGLTILQSFFPSLYLFASLSCQSPVSCQYFVVSDTQIRVEGESLHIRYNTDTNIVKFLKDTGNKK